MGRPFGLPSIGVSRCTGQFTAAQGTDSRLLVWVCFAGKPCFAHAGKPHHLVSFRQALSCTCRQASLSFVLKASLASRMHLHSSVPSDCSSLLAAGQSPSLSRPGQHCATLLFTALQHSLHLVPSAQRPHSARLWGALLRAAACGALTLRFSRMSFSTSSSCAAFSSRPMRMLPPASPGTSVSHGYASLLTQGGCRTGSQKQHPAFCGTCCVQHSAHAGFASQACIVMLETGMHCHAGDKCCMHCHAGDRHALSCWRQACIVMLETSAACIVMLETGMHCHAGDKCCMHCHAGDRHALSCWRQVSSIVMQETSAQMSTQPTGNWQHARKEVPTLRARGRPTKPCSEPPQTRMRQELAMHFQVQGNKHVVNREHPGMQNDARHVASSQ